MWRVAPLILALLWPTTLSAKAIKVMEVLDAATSEPQLRKLVGQTGDSIMWASIYGESKFGQPIFCSPSNLAITDDQFVQIARSYLTKFPEMQSSTWPTFPHIMILALVDTFPCP